jgi:hypothetical protein
LVLWFSDFLFSKYLTPFVVLCFWFFFKYLEWTIFWFWLKKKWTTGKLTPTLWSW